MSIGNKRAALVAQLDGLIAQMEQRAPDTPTGLAELVGSAVEGVPGSQYAGITETRRGAIGTAAATHRYPMVLDQIQHQYRDGPCVSAACEHRTVHIDDLASDRRWPRYRRAALAQTPIRSILSFELLTNRETRAALNFQADQPFAFDEESIEVGLIFATHIALAWRTLRRDEQFRSALASRDIIGQAKGMVMERYNLDADQAFDLLRHLSQSSNTKVADVAQRIVQAQRPSPTS